MLISAHDGEGRHHRDSLVFFALYSFLSSVYDVLKPSKLEVQESWRKSGSCVVGTNWDWGKEGVCGINKFNVYSG